jgi:hypothetical protein
MLRQRPLRLLSRGDGIRGSREDREAGIALRVDFATSLPLEDDPQESPVVVQHAGVRCAESLEELRGTFDVGEEEGDRPGR